jgi:hypothetical protein
MFSFSALGRLFALCAAACLTVFAVASSASAAVVPEVGDPAPTGTISPAASHGSGTNVGLVVAVAILAAVVVALLALMAAGRRHRSHLLSAAS